MNAATTDTYTRTSGTNRIANIESFVASLTAGGSTVAAGTGGFVGVIGR